MKKNALIWGTAIILIFIAAVVTSKNISSNKYSQSSSASPLEKTSISLIDSGSRQKAADFTLTDLAGNSVSLKKLRGKNVYINFWATWCPWCKKELPDLEKVAQEFKNENLIVFAVDVGEDKTVVSNYMRENHYGFNVLLDTDKNMAQQYSVTSIPVSVFIDKDGNIAQRNVGVMSESQMKTIINKLLGK
ncbi:MAG: TlpA disulfide reductase family protein [Ethanoligenens sp.]